jgi:hypothetical protein
MQHAHLRRVVTAAVAVAATALSFAAAAPATGRAHGTIAVFKASQSSNWFGYNQGILEKGTPFTSIAGDWTVPKASLHKSGQDEYSSTWVGIGGGCLDTGCTATDATLIQAGTEQDISGKGATSYYAWWEVIPAPSLQIAMTVVPGDHMHVAISQVATGVNVWTITVVDVNRHETFSQTVPYTSTMATAEWIEETPTIIGTSGAGLAALPRLSTVHFDLAQVNGALAGLAPAEEIQLVNSSGKVIGTPSSPDSDRDGFNACTWTTSCSAPSSS